MQPRKRNNTCAYDGLEARQLLAGITFDAATGIVSIEGSPEADRVLVSMPSTSEIRVDFESVDRQDFTFSDVTKIVFLADAGDDHFENQTSVPSQVFGGVGDDSFIGGSGPDELRGGVGMDFLSGNDGDDFLRGDDGNDVLDGGRGNDLLVGAEGDDQLYGRHGQDNLIGGDGDDQAWAGAGDDFVSGNEGRDRIWGGGGHDILLGHAGEDVIFGEAGHDQIYANDGDDSLLGGPGADTLVGGGGVDNIWGNEGADRIFGSAGHDWASGGPGQDLVAGNDGDDRLLGGEGNDQIWGGLGNDRLVGESDVDRLFGEQGDDQLFGGDHNDFLFGNEGADLLNGGAGDDVLQGGDGNDSLVGEAGADRLFGYLGHDYLSGGRGEDQLYGFTGDDILLGGENDDELIAFEGNDYARGDQGDDVIYGGPGNDTLLGSEDDDRLFGQEGDDSIRGGSGRDILMGNQGVDLLDGGLGDDDVYASSEDRVVSDDEDSDDDDEETTGRPYGLGQRVTVSFAPDGTSIFNQSNSLFAAFSSILNPVELQSSLLTAFDTWARNGNLDVGLVADSGDDFGVSGKSYGDPRFGDIRIGAIPLPGGVNAIAIGQDDLVSGTWGGEILFNANADFDSPEEFFAVALHEVGHVLGLHHTDAIDSVMHRYNNRTTLHPDDVARFRELYGMRALDRNDDDGGNNDTFEDATDLRFEGENDEEGRSPTIAFADISSGQDVDFFEIRIPDHYSGAASFHVISRAISQLGFAATLYDASGNELESIATDESWGDEVQFSRQVSPDDRYFVKVEGQDESVGSFSLAANLDDHSSVSYAEMLEVAVGRQFVNFEPEDLAEYFSDPTGFLIEDDGNTNDDRFNATELATEDGFELFTRYEFQGSLTNAEDVDYYRFQTPDDVGALTTLNVSVRALEFQGMTPSIRLLDSQGKPVDVSVAVNGHGEYALQYSHFTPGTEYLLEIQSDSLLEFQNGNYELVISQSEHPVDFQILSNGTLNAGDRQYSSLHVAEGQMFQFALEARVTTNASPEDLLWATIYDESGSKVYTAATRPGERRTSKTVLLEPGSYTIEFEAGEGASFQDLEYQIQGLDIGDPQGPTFTDPGDSPFDQNGNGEYEYPDGVISLAAFVVVDGISSNQNDPPQDPPPSNVYRWYWGI